MPDDDPIERYRVYTRDEAATLMKMTAMEMDDILQAAGATIVDTGHRRVYLGEVLLRVMGADFSSHSNIQPSLSEISAQTVYSIEQAARLMAISVRTLRRLAREGQIKPTHVRGRVVYQGQDLIHFFKEKQA